MAASTQADSGNPPRPTKVLSQNMKPPGGFPMEI